MLTQGLLSFKPKSGKTIVLQKLLSLASRTTVEADGGGGGGGGGGPGETYHCD